MLKPLAVLVAIIVATLTLAAPAGAESHAHSPVRAGWVEEIKCDWVPLRPGSPILVGVNCHSVWVHPGHGLHR